MKPKIKKINYGIGFCVAENGKNLYIELNKNLDKYPILKREVLKHEMLHWGSKSFWNDFKIDLYDIFNLNKQKNLFKFQLKHPKAFMSNSPFFVENGNIIPNYFMCVTYGVLLSVLIVGGSLL